MTSGLIGCDGSAPTSFAPRIVLTDRSTHPLMLAELQSANGLYSMDCASHGGEAWSAPIVPGASLANRALLVARGDSACVLSLTSLTGSQEYTASAAITLASNFQPFSTPFAGTAVPGDVAFYGNAFLNDPTFSVPSVISIIFSNDPSRVSTSNTATAAETGIAQAFGQEAPNYSLDMGEVFVETDVDGLVTSATGSAFLFFNGTQPGQAYVVVNTPLTGTPTFDEIDTAFKAGPQVLLGGTLGGAIDTSQFQLVTLEEPNVRYVIVGNTQFDVPSYQLFTITFNRSPDPIVGP
jgi:hypothetical protein